MVFGAETIENSLWQRFAKELSPFLEINSKSLIPFSIFLKALK